MKCHSKDLTQINMSSLSAYLVTDHLSLHIIDGHSEAGGALAPEQNLNCLNLNLLLLDLPFPNQLIPLHVNV